MKKSNDAGAVLLKESISGWRILGVTRSLAGSRTPKVWAGLHNPRGFGMLRIVHKKLVDRTMRLLYDEPLPGRECRVRRYRAGRRPRGIGPEFSGGGGSALPEAGASYILENSRRTGSGASSSSHWARGGGSVRAAWRCPRKRSSLPGGVPGGVRPAHGLARSARRGRPLQFEGARIAGESQPEFDLLCTRAVCYPCAHRLGWGFLSGGYTR